MARTPLRSAGIPRVSLSVHAPYTYQRHGVAWLSTSSCGWQAQGRKSVRHHGENWYRLGHRIRGGDLYGALSSVLRMGHFGYFVTIIALALGVWYFYSSRLLR